MQITICSSIDFTPKIIEVKRDLEQLSHTTNIPYFTQQVIDGTLSFENYMNLKEREGDIEMRKTRPVDMIRRYWEFIRAGDAILVLNMSKKGIDGYIGGSTLMEMGFAYGHNKKIYLYNPIPQRSERIHYIDEILDMDSIVIDTDLRKIK
ncbi:MAG TPA: hypothetical protein VJK51_04470 [Candidatus Nanoarchaeia archaeon]|nr:hypothetical protein [Candidatus Nanoarchaeia archaeon]